MTRPRLRLTGLLALEALAVILALALFVAGAAMWRLASGPIEAGFLRDTAKSALAEAFGGDSAEVGELSLRYWPRMSALVIEAEDVVILDARGAPITASDRIEAGLALDLLLIGRARPVAVRATGGSFSVVRRGDGSWAAGIGFPEAVAAGEPAPRGAAWPALDADGGLSRLRRVALSGVRLRYKDERDGLDLILDSAEGSADFADGGIAAEMSARILTPRGPAPLALSLRADADLDALFLDLRVEDLSPASVSPARGPLSLLSRIDAPAGGALVIDASRQSGLRSFLADLELGEGRYGRGAQAVALDGGRASLTYDASEAEIGIHELRLSGERLSLEAEGRIFDIGEFESALPGRARYEIEAGAGRLDLPGVFPRPLEWERLRAEGVLSPLHRRIRFDALEADLPFAAARLEGVIGLEDTEAGLRPALALSGPIEGSVGKDDVLSLWPSDFALGARDWVEERILAGRVFNTRLDLDIPAEAFAAGGLEDEMLSLAFDYEGGAVRYVLTMEVLEGLSGSAELRGNSLSLTGGGGRIGALEMGEVFVDIPRLNPRGAMARFGGSGTGPLPALFELVSGPPLEATEQYGLDPAEWEGQGEVSFEIRRPMLSDVPYEDIGYSVSGRFADVSGPAGLSGLRFANGVAQFAIDPEGMTIDGRVGIGGGDADIAWRQTFGLPEDAPVTTTLAIEGRTTARDLDQLGLPLRQFMDGRVGVRAELSGRGMDFVRYEADLDLTEAAVDLPGGLWTKRPGQPARVAFEAAASDGAVSMPRFSAQGEGMRIEAEADLASDGRLLEARLESLFVEGAMDLHGAADRPEGPDGPLRVRLRGPFLDATGLIDQMLSGGFGGGDDGGAISLAVSVDDVRIRTVRYDDLFLSARTGEEGLEAFQLSGYAGGTATGIRLADAEDGTGRRALSVETGDAGLLLEAMSGFSNISGGALSLTGMMPAPGQDGAVEGRLQTTGFRLDRMPLLARVLAAGSLEGLASLLGGQGIDFDTLQADYVWTDGVLEMREARVAGPALGLTWAGVVNLPGERLAVDGTLLPSYGANAFLGYLPVVGELLVSRRGEGVIGITYSVEGPFEGARVITNPLSALAPGVFRRIFEGTSAMRELDALEAERQAEEEEEAEPGGQEP